MTELYGKHHQLEDIFIDKNFPNTTKKTILIPNYKCFWLENLLTKKECQTYIELAEKLGFEELKEFTDEIRQSKRMFIYSKTLGNELWRRILKFSSEFKNLQPYGITDNEGTWVPYGVDECFRVSRYKKENFFKKHVDSVYVQEDDEKSVLSILIYLNDNFKGGETALYLSFNDERPYHTVPPKQGGALIFTHDLIHEGLKIESETKYIMRVDIMFKRIDSKTYIPKIGKNSQEFLAVTKCFDDSFKFESQGDLKKSVELYIEAVNLQLKSPSVIENSLVFPSEVFCHIFKFLTPKDIVKTMNVSREWNKYTRDTSLWYIFYQRRFEELKFNPLEDWFFLYAKRIISEREFRYLIFEMNEKTTDFMFFDQEKARKIFTTNQVFARTNPHGQVQRYDVTFGFSTGTYFMKNMKQYNFQYLKKFVDYCVTQLNGKIDKHPLLFIDKGFPLNMKETMIKELEGSSGLFFLPRGVALLASKSIKDGLIFYKEESKILLEYYINNKLVESRELKSNEESKFIESIQDNKNIIFYQMETEFSSLSKYYEKTHNVFNLQSQDLFKGASLLCKLSHNLFDISNADLMIQSAYGTYQQKLISKYSSLILKDYEMIKKEDIERFSINCYNNLGRTPLHISTYYCKIDEVKNYIKFGGDYQLKEKKFGQNILHISVSRCYTNPQSAFEIVKYCVEELKMDVNQKDKDGWTPLHIAYWKDLKNVMKYLQDHGADNKIKDNHKQTPEMVYKGFLPQDPYKIYY